MLFTNWILALLIFVIVSASVAGLLILLQKSSWAKNYNLSELLLLSIGLYSNGVMISGLLWGYKDWVQVLLALPGLLVLLKSRPWEHTSRSTIRSVLGSNKNWIWLIFPALYFVVRFFSAGLPQQHSDAMYYHVVAAKHWAEWGRIILENTHPSWAQSTLLETVFGIPFLWLSERGLSTNITAHLFSQWIHMFWGQVSSVIVAAAILKHHLGKNIENSTPLTLRIFVGWLCICIPCLEWTGALAKTDYMLLAFILGGYLAARRGHFVMSGLLLGFAYEVKFFAVWSIAAIALIIPVKKWPKFLGALFLTALPLIAKNTVFTGNPIFPGLDHILGPHWVSDAWNAANATFVGLPTWTPGMIEWWGRAAFESALPKALFAIGMSALVFNTLLRKKSLAPDGTGAPSIKYDVVIFFVQALFLTVVLRPVANGRYSGSTTALVTLALMAQVLFLMTSTLARHKYITYLLLGLGFLVNIPVELIVKVPRNYLFKDRVTYIEHFHPNYPVLAWLNTHTAPGSNIYFNTDKVNLYLDRPYEIITEMRKWEQELTPLTDLPTLLSKLAAHGFTHAQFSLESRGYAPIEPYPARILEAGIKPVFRYGNELVFDLQD